MFNAVKRTDIYGDDDAAALRDLLFSWWEERFLQAHAGAPAIESSMMDADACGHTRARCMPPEK